MEDNLLIRTVLSGQRYDILVTANQSSVADNFWMRAIPQSACSSNDNSDDIRGIVYYGSSAGTLETTGYSYTDSCDDEDVSNLVPYVSKTVSGETVTEKESATVAKNSDSLFRWYLNSTTMVVDWADHTAAGVRGRDQLRAHPTQSSRCPTPTSGSTWSSARPWA